MNYSFFFISKISKCDFNILLFTILNLLVISKNYKLSTFYNPMVEFFSFLVLLATILIVFGFSKIKFFSLSIKNIIIQHNSKKVII